MKLLYVIPTRGRPLNLLGTISTAWRLRSGAHDVQFSAVSDADDGVSSYLIDEAVSRDRAVSGVTEALLMSRPDALGSKWNRPFTSDRACIRSIDAALLMTDRMIPITPGWDDVVAKCLTKFPNRVLWWKSPTDPGTVAPVVPRSWLEAMDWKPAVERFPYWFIDTHLMELDRLIFGGNSLMMPVHYAGERKATMELRDCGFWCSYYAALRPERIAQAKLIAGCLGVEWVDRPELLAEFGAQDAMRIQRAPEFEKVFGDPSEPWDGYRRIKAEAQVWMDTQGQSIQASYEIAQRLAEAGYPMDAGTERAIQTAALDALAGL